MTLGYSFAISPRKSREFCFDVPPSKDRGRRECRAPDAPDCRVCHDSDRTHTRWSGHTGNRPAFPTQWFYGL